MEGEAFDPNPQASSSPEQESKETEDGNKYQAASNIEFTPDRLQPSGGNHSPPPALEEDTHNDVVIPPTTTTTSTTWRDKLPEVVRHGADAVQSTLEATIHHPYVTQGAETVRQGAESVRQGLGQTSGFVGESVTSAQSRLGPLVNHPYVQKTTETVSSTLQPLMNKSAETMQRGSETAKKIYNREEGYEPSKLAPYFAGSLGIVILCILLAGWGSGDRWSKYKIDISGIVAEKIELPDGRHIAYVEQGVSKELAKHNILVLHGFLSSRLAGIPGISDKLLEKYAVRLVSYDRPGIGQSDPHPKRNYNTSAQDMAYIADALGMGDKFWVLGYSGGGPHTWAALHYIPNRLAGVVMFAPMGNPYAKNMTKEESKIIWKGASRGLKMMFRLAHHFPSYLPGYLRRGPVTKIVKFLRSTKKMVNPKDRAVLETDTLGEHWERSTRESIRSGDPKPHAEDVILHCNDWGFKLTDLNPKPAKRSFFKRLFFFFSGPELPVFNGPVHIFHGTEDKIVPLAYSEYATRLVPHVQLHKLEGEGHFSWFCHCNTCHRELFKILFGEVEGLHELDAPEPEATKKIEVTGNPKHKEESHAAKSEEHHEAHEVQSSFPSKAEHIMSREAEVGILSEDDDDRVTTHHHENHEEEDEL